MRILIDPAGEQLKDDPWPAYREDQDAGAGQTPGGDVARDANASAAGDAGADQTPAGEPKDYTLIQLQQLSQATQQLANQDVKLGLRIPGDLTARQLIEELGDPELLHQFALIQVEIPALKDGRCFSLAARLRDQYNYTGELRAAGNYLPDQIYFLRRCGFDSFSIATQLDAATLARTLKPFSEVYQTSTDAAETVIAKQLAD